jgi:hypothetical protein
MINRRSSKLIAAAIAGTTLLGLSACSSDGKSSSAQAADNTTAAAVTTVAPATVAPQPAATNAAPSPTEAAPADTTPAPADTAGAVTTPPATAGGKVNINDASVSDLEAAFKAAGVTSARRWAQEVDEYRPYPADPDFAKLRQELGKYNIDPKVLELIISLLEF